MIVTFQVNDETYAVPGMEPSQNPKPADREAENLRIFGQGTLTDIHRKYGMDGLMMAYKDVAKAYDVDAEALLDWWIKDVGVWKAMKA